MGSPHIVDVIDRGQTEHRLHLVVRDYLAVLYLLQALLDSLKNEEVVLDVLETCVVG